MLHFHKYPDENYQYVRDGSCVQQASCAHQGCEHVSDFREHHTPGNPTWGPGPCEYQTRCTRCQRILAHAVEHDWTPWSFDHEKNCTITRRCKREGCKEAQRGMTHTGLATPRYQSPDACDLITTCQRCSQDVLLHTTGHAFAPQYVDDTTCHVANICLRCGNHEGIITAGIKELLDRDQHHVLAPDGITCMRCHNKQH